MKPTTNSTLLTDLPPYIYGTTRLGDDRIPFADRVKMAHVAMDSGVWFHTSNQYNDALRVLRVAFDEDRAKVTKLIIKIGGDSIGELRNDIQKNLEPLGLENMEIGQLCLGTGALAHDFANGGECYHEFLKIKAEGLVNRFVLEVFPWTSITALNALKGNYPTGIVDGYIYYLNPLQRFVSNELWELLNERNEPQIALRTVAGGPVHRLRDVPGAAWKEYLQHRAVEVAPVFERSGVENWTDFCMRFAFSFDNIRATVGSTSHAENLTEFLKFSKHIQPLPAAIIDEITTLQQRWSDETDMKAELWSM
ncbi:MAG: hypothetical protein P4L34_01555 [Paludibacter sp.]|nr:hypothetical protein [Paludibacter sp.]